MAEIVKNYETEYQKTSAYIKAEFNQLSITEARDDKLRLIGAIHNEITQAENTLNLMEYQIPGLQQADKAKYNQNLKKYKTELEASKKNIQRYKEEFGWEQDKENLFPREGGSKERLLGGKGNVLVDQNNKLIEAKKLAFEAEGVSINVQRELVRNTDVLQNALTKANQTNAEVGTSNSILNTMQRRVILNKIVFYIVIAAILLAFGLIVYFKFIA